MRYRYNLDELEKVTDCPYCHSTSISSSITLEDYAFKCVDGVWTFVKCNSCSSIYLDRRPKPEALYHAYKNYFTHGNEGGESFYKLAENEIISANCNIDLRPRLNSPLMVVWKILGSLILYRFPLNIVRKRIPGKLLDVGCGDGKLLKILKLMGWNVKGFEIDPVSADIAIRSGLDVENASYENISRSGDLYDIVIASHVIEHVYSPREFLNSLMNRTKISGSVIISCPNPDSFLAIIFRKYWFGYDAPRHLAIPSFEFLTKYIENTGNKIVFHKSPYITFWGSMSNYVGKWTFAARLFGKIVQLYPSILIPQKYCDFIQAEIIVERHVN